MFDRGLMVFVHAFPLAQAAELVAHHRPLEEGNEVAAGHVPQVGPDAVEARGNRVQLRTQRRRVVAHYRQALGPDPLQISAAPGLPQRVAQTGPPARQWLLTDRLILAP